MVPSLSVMKTNWLESQPKVLAKKYKESNVCVAGGMKVILHYSVKILDISGENIEKVGIGWHG